MKVDRFFSTFKTAAQGMDIQRRQLAISAENIANAYTTRTDEGGAYKPKTMVQSRSDENKFQLSFQESLLRLRGTRGQHFEKDYTRDMQKVADGMGPDTQIVEQEKYRYEYDPHHPDADENGMVKYPDLDLIEEMTQMVSANRLYEANLSVIEAEKQVIKRAFEI